MTEVICGKEKIVLLKDSFLYEVLKRKNSFYFILKNFAEYGVIGSWKTPFFFLRTVLSS